MSMMFLNDLFVVLDDIKSIELVLDVFDGILHTRVHVEFDLVHF